MSDRPSIDKQVVDLIIQTVTELMPKIPIDSNNKGDMWNGFEDEQLQTAFDAFIETQARIHGRTVGAIHSRIKQNFFN